MIDWKPYNDAVLRRVFQAAIDNAEAVKLFYKNRRMPKVIRYKPVEDNSNLQLCDY